MSYFNSSLIGCNNNALDQLNTLTSSSYICLHAKVFVIVLMVKQLTFIDLLNYKKSLKTADEAWGVRMHKMIENEVRI